MEKNKKGISIRQKTVKAMVLVIIVQISVVICAIMASGVANKLEENGFKIFFQTVNNRRDYLAAELSNAVVTLDDHIYGTVEAYELEMQGKNPQSEKNILGFFEKRLDSTIELLRNSGTTGAFVILNDDTKNTDTHSALYVVDSDPKHNDLRKHSDIFVLKGPKEIFTNNKIAAHMDWNYGITLEEEQKGLFERPYNAGMDPNNKGKNLGYWYVGTGFYSEDDKMIAYVKPIITKDGTVVGVMGVEISERYLFSMLPENEINDSISSGYVIAQGNENHGYKPAIVDGAYLENILPYNKEIYLKEENVESNGYSLKSNNDIVIIKEKLNLYGKNSPFRYEELYLLGISDVDIITEGSGSLKKSMIISVVLSFLLSVVVSIFVGKFISKSTKELMTGIENVKPGKEIILARTGIKELDALAESVEDLNKKAIESVVKTDKIISMIDTDIGFFAFNFKETLADVSPNLIYMFCLENEVNEDGSVDMDVIMRALEALKRNKTDEDVYKLVKNNITKWFKLESIGTETGELGVAIDVTKEELAKQTLMHERDFDMLTGVYNRFAFHRIAKQIIEEQHVSIAAFAMGDLDNLKHINDTYGHDTGDLYIKSIANYLRTYFEGKKVLYARMSGDEFYIFIYGYDTKEEIRSILYGLNLEMGNEYIDLPDRTKFRLRMSIGLAWYPEDGQTIEELSRLSDFAMYQGKHSIKGSVREFDGNAYENESYMFTGKEELVAILDNQLFEYAFQPIIECGTGEIYGYEALIRPSGKTINTPTKLINLAKIQGQLWKVEKNTFYTVLELSHKYADYLGERKIFINSIPNQILKEVEYDDLERNYKDILNRLVIEITECEDMDEEILVKKKKMVEKWNAMIAIDDYGSGYANETLLVNLKPNIIKIDRFLVSDIENNKDKYALVKNLINFAKKNSIMVIAEGVETREQVEVVVKMGVDMIQGFYASQPLSIPKFDSSEIKSILKNIRQS